MATAQAALLEQGAKRSALMDVAGAFGDIGVLFPIAIALITLNHLNPTAVFLCAGLTYVLTGRYFQLPIPVQPLKAVAAIALATGLPASAIASAGVMMGVLLGLVAITNTAQWIAKLFSLPIVRGIQLGLGLLLIREGIRLIFGKQAILAFPNGFSLNGWIVAVVAAAVLLALRKSERYPAALALLIAGIAAGVAAQWGKMAIAAWGPQPIELLHPSLKEFWMVLPLLVVPQFALTFGNSIVATENTAKLLYKDQACRVTSRGLCASIAIVNLISGFLQAAPMCHGSGGVTAHYRFGARTAKSNYIIGAVCLLLAGFGGAAIGVLHLIPVAVLGVFLVYVGVQHAMYLLDIVKQIPLLLIALSVGAVSIITTNVMWGFLAGFAVQGVVFLFTKTLRPRAA